MLSHPQGAIVVGCVASGVLYTRFLEAVPVPLGIRFAFLYGKLLQSASSVRYFADTSELEFYDDASWTSARSLTHTQRQRFASIDILVPTRAMEIVTRSFGARLGGDLSDRARFWSARAIMRRRIVDAAWGGAPRNWKSVPARVDSRQDSAG
jgi:hypothetical protein